MRINRRTLAACGAAALATGAAVAGSTQANADGPKNVFAMHRSPGIVTAGCVPYAKAKVVVRNEGPVEVMKVHASGPAQAHRLRPVRHPGAQRPVRCRVVPG